MIIIKDLFIKIIPNGNSIYHSLVCCEDCLKERAIYKQQAVRTYKHLCKPCSMIGYRNHQYGKKGASSPNFKRKQVPLTLDQKNRQSLSLKGRKRSQESINKQKKSILLFLKDNPEHYKTRKMRSGPDHYLWNPNRTREQRYKERKTIEDRLWSKNILKRDNYICQLSGQIGGKLVAHHIEGWNIYPEKRLDINNGITIAEWIHKLFHKIYGNGKNTKLQFEEFKENYSKGLLNYLIK